MNAIDLFELSLAAIQSNSEGIESRFMGTVASTKEHVQTLNQIQDTTAYITTSLNHSLNPTEEVEDGGINNLTVKLREGITFLNPLGHR